MRNIFVFSNRLDESNGIVEHVLEMKATAKKMPWFLRFAQKAKGIVSFVQNLLTRKESVRSGQVSAFFQPAAAVVGIGLLSGSLSLFAEPIGVGRGVDEPPFENVCAPVVSSITVTDDGSAGFRVSVDISHGWDMFRRHSRDSDGNFIWGKGYTFRFNNAVLHTYRKRGDFWGRFRGTVLKTRSYESGCPVHFDYFARGGTGGKYFEMKIEPKEVKLQHVRDKHYYPGDHWVDITLYVTDRDGKGNRLPNGGYNMHCWVSDTDGNGYYVTVYFGGEAFF